MPDVWSSGTQNITADGVVGTSGAVTRLFNMHVISTGGGGAVINVRNGTLVTDTIFIKETGTVSTGKTFDYGLHGHVFSSGCYVDIDGNTTSVAVNYSQGN